MLNEVERTEVNQNNEEYTRCDLDYKDLEEWFEVETVSGEDTYYCNFCDLQVHENKIMKEHLISKHREVSCTLSSNSIKYLGNY